MHVLRWQAKNMHRNFLPDLIFLFNHNEERTIMMMMNPWLSIQFNSIYLNSKIERHKPMP